MNMILQDLITPKNINTYKILCVFLWSNYFPIAEFNTLRFILEMIKLHL